MPVYAGKFLRINLTEGSWHEETIADEAVRRWLLGHGYGIVAERIVLERGRFYVALAAEPGTAAARPDGPVLDRELLEEAGPCLVRSADPRRAAGTGPRRTARPAAGRHCRGNGLRRDGGSHRACPRGTSQELWPHAAEDCVRPRSGCPRCPRTPAYPNGRFSGRIDHCPRM